LKFLPRQIQDEFSRSLANSHSFFLVFSIPFPAFAQQTSDHAPTVTKVEPPNWWINLTPDVLLLLYGHDLEATQVTCNIPEVIVSRTQSHIKATISLSG